MADGILWFTKDRYENEIYLTEERWAHITDPANHPELNHLVDELRQTIQVGQRKQDSLNPQKYRYSHAFSTLPEENTHIVAIVLFRFREDVNSRPVPNNYVATAFLKELS